MQGWTCCQSPSHTRLLPQRFVDFWIDPDRLNGFDQWLLLAVAAHR
jgi:hypothetical protein